MTLQVARFSPLGDSTLLVIFGDDADPATNELVRRAAALLEDSPPHGSVEIVPAINSLAIAYDPLVVRHLELTREVSALLQARSDADVLPPGRTVEIPVVYGGDFGPDLQDVAAHNGLSEEEVIAIHAEPGYLVYMIGFTPGFPYLGGMSERIATPRLASPRPAVPSGSVGIAGSQTGVYPQATPGGWRLIGRTPLALFDPAGDPPALLAGGDKVRFRPIAPDAYEALLEEAGA